MRKFGLISTVLLITLMTAGVSVMAKDKDDLIAMSDEFNDAASLSNWTLHHEAEGWPSQIDVLNVNQSTPGSLHLIPYTGTWYGDYRGVYAYKQIKGDFTVSTRMLVSGKSSDRPTGAFELAGLLIRAPKSITPGTWEPNKENWVYLNHGTPGVPDHMVLDSKTNVNSKFTWEETSSKEGWIEFKMVRIGNAIFQFYKYDEQTKWSFLKRYDRTDLPETLQVGMNAHGNTKKSFGMKPFEFNSTVFKSDADHADLVADFDFVRFQRPDLPDKIKAKILDGTATEQQLIHFLTEKQ